MNTKKQGKTMDMTEGNPFKIVFFFAMPIFFGMILQNLYNIFDTAIAGHILGDHALAAIGATGSIYNMLVSLAMGLNNGFSLLISRAFGKKNREELNLSIFWTLLLNAAVVLLLTSCSLGFLDALLRAMNTPAEIYPEAKTYIAIILAGIPVTMAYNMSSTVLRSMGNSSTPLVCLAISSVLNILLNLLFVAVFHWGVAGLAIATVAAQLIAAAYCVWYIIARYPDIKLSKKYLRAPKGYVSDMFLTGLSMGLMNSVVSFGSAVLQSAVNKLGSIYIAGQIGGSRIEVTFVGLANSFSNSSATYVSQNFGAGRRDRIRRGIVATLTLGFSASIIGIIFALTPLSPICMRLITGSDNPEVIASGSLFVKITLLTMPFLCTLLTFRNTMQGMGHKIIPLVASAIEMGGKLFFAWVLVPRFGYRAVCFCEPSLWILSSLYLFVVIFILRAEFRDDYKPKTGLKA